MPFQSLSSQRSGLPIPDNVELTSAGKRRVRHDWRLFDCPISTSAERCDMEKEGTFHSVLSRSFEKANVCFEKFSGRAM